MSSAISNSRADARERARHDADEAAATLESICASLDLPARAVVDVTARGVGLIARISVGTDGEPEITVGRAVRVNRKRIVPPVPAAQSSADLSPAELRQSLRLSHEKAATAYRNALASPDPRQNRRPTAAAAEKFGVSRGHMSRLISEARQRGLPGLGEPRAW